MKTNALKYYSRGFVFLFFLVCPTFSLFSQNQKVADSLLIIYKRNNLTTSEKLELLRNLSFNEVTNLEQSLKYADELITLAKSENDYLYLSRGYYQKGNKNRVAGNLKQALTAFFKSREAAQMAQHPILEGLSISAIAASVR